MKINDIFSLFTNTSRHVILFLDACRMKFRCRKMIVFTCLRKQASSFWKSKMFSWLMLDFTLVPWWIMLGRLLWLQNSWFKVWLKQTKREKMQTCQLNVFQELGQFFFYSPKLFPSSCFYRVTPKLWSKHTGLIFFKVAFYFIQAPFSSSWSHLKNWRHLGSEIGGDGDDEDVILFNCFCSHKLLKGVMVHKRVRFSH